MRDGGFDGVGPGRDPHREDGEGESMETVALQEPLGDLVLVDLVNRVLDRGVVLSGEVTVSVAGVDLLYLDLRLLLSSVETLRPARERGAGEASAAPNRPGAASFPEEG